MVVFYERWSHMARMSNIHKRIRFVKLMVHWYQWYDWYQQKSNLLQWFYWWICISLRGLRLFSHVTWLGTGQFRWSIGTNGNAIPMILLVQNKFAFTTSRNALIIIMNIPSFYKTITQNKFAFTPSRNVLIIIMNIPRSIRQPRKTSSLLRQVKACCNS